VSTYAEDLHRCKVILLLRATMAARGSMSKAAVAIGVHRNTIRRVLYGAGYTAKSLRLLAKACSVKGQRKTVQSAGAAVEERMSA